MFDLKEKIKREKIIAIIRGIPSGNIQGLAAALEKGGVKLIEVAFNQKAPESAVDTAKAISIIHDEFPDIAVGAGTVIDIKLLKLAADAGAQFILSPDTNIEVIEQTKKLGLVSIPGALTPSECTAAYRAGADFIKLFPAGLFGEKYLKAISAPLSHIPFICVGNIDLDNIPSFLKCGAKGFGIGSNLVDAKTVAEGNFDVITRRAEAFVKAVGNN